MLSRLEVVLNQPPMLPRRAMPLGYAAWCRNVRLSARTPKEIIPQTRRVSTESSQSWKSFHIFTGFLARIRGYPCYCIIAKYLLQNNVARLDFLILDGKLSYMDKAQCNKHGHIYIYIYMCIVIYIHTPLGSNYIFQVHNTFCFMCLHIFAEEIAHKRILNVIFQLKVVAFNNAYRVAKSYFFLNILSS